MPEETPKKPTNYNFPSNTNKKQGEGKDKEPKEKKEKVVTKIITGEAKTRKKPLSRKIAETFTGDDAHSVGHYILFEVIIPAAKNTLSDAVSQGIERMLFGEARRRPGSSNRGVTYTSYNRMYDRNERTSSGPQRPQMSQRGRATHDFEELILDTKAEAESIIEQMDMIIEQFDQTTVSDLYDLVGITGAYTDDKYGWTDLRDAGVRQIREGWLLVLPRPVSLR